MWYTPFISYNNLLTFKVKKSVKKDFLKFCQEEVFWDSKKLSVPFLIEKLDKNIFLSQSLSKSQKKFLGFNLAILTEKGIDLNTKNIEDFFDDENKSNPLQILLMGNHYTYCTVKQITDFFAYVNPYANPETEKMYISDFKEVFSETYFTSKEFKIILKENALLFKQLYSQLKTIENNLLKNELEEEEVTLNISNLLRTELITRKPFEKKDLLNTFIEQKILRPNMVQDSTSVVPKTIFEYTMMHPSSNLIWWLEKTVIESEKEFNFKEMIIYFESFLGNNFYLKDFPKELKNFKDIISLMKKIEFKQSLELSYLEENTKEKSKGKI